MSSNDEAKRPLLAILFVSLIGTVVLTPLGFFVDPFEFRAEFDLFPGLAGLVYIIGLFEALILGALVGWSTTWPSHRDWGRYTSSMLFYSLLIIPVAFIVEAAQSAAMPFLGGDYFLTQFGLFVFTYVGFGYYHKPKEGFARVSASPSLEGAH